MKVSIDGKQLAKLALVSIIAVIVSLVIAIATNVWGIGLSLRAVYGSIPLIFGILVIWITLVGIAKGWIRVSGQ